MVKFACKHLAVSFTKFIVAIFYFGTVRQSLHSRTDNLDANPMPILRIDEIPVFTKPARLWLNIPV